MMIIEFMETSSRECSLESPSGRRNLIRLGRFRNDHAYVLENFPGSQRPLMPSAGLNETQISSAHAWRFACIWRFAQVGISWNFLQENP